MSPRKTAGFAEAPQQAFTVEAAPDEAQGGRLKVGPGGRVLIPADMRAALGVVEGDVLLAKLDDGILQLMSSATAVKRAQALVRALVNPTPSMADELIAERRAETARDGR